MNRGAVLIYFLLIVALFAGFTIYQNYQSMSHTFNAVVEPTPVVQNEIFPRKAYFAVFTRGTKRSFSDDFYHNLSHVVYIKEDNPHTVYVDRPGVTWGDFFATLPMEMTEECLTTGTGQRFCTSEEAPLKFYINGKRVTNFLNREIFDGDKALISVGDENDLQIQFQMAQIGFQ